VRGVPEAVWVGSAVEVLERAADDLSDLDALAERAASARN
jgi:hypothetical protein